MRILLFGSSGRLGSVLAKELASLGELILADRGALEWCDDVQCADRVRATVNMVRPDFIVNAVAYTDVDRAETERRRALALNATAPALLAELAEGAGAWLIHYSSDYVFSGQSSYGWKESDTPEPLCWYARSKLLGDVAVQQSSSKYAIFRIGWLYGPYGNNFAVKIIKALLENRAVEVVDDQFGTPTATNFVAGATVTAMQALSRGSATGGLFHVAPSGMTSWYRYALFLLDRLHAEDLALAVAPSAIVPIQTPAMSNRARRPQYSALNTQKMRREFGIMSTEWERGVAEFVKKFAADVHRPTGAVKNGTAQC